MRHPFTLILSCKLAPIVKYALAFLFIFLCSCEKDNVSPDPDRLGDFEPNCIYIGKTTGSAAIGGSGSSAQVVLLYMQQAWIFYRVGTVDPNSETINWGSETNWPESNVADCSISPSVSVSENNVVAAAFQTANYQENPTGHVYAAVGTISGNSINWAGFIYIVPGYYPAISITRDGKYAVLIYQGSKNGGALYFQVGAVNAESNSISWGEPVWFAAGYLPSIAMNDKDQIVTIFNSWQNNNGLWYMTGILNRGAYSVGWGDTISFNTTQRSTGGSKVGLGDYFEAAPNVPAGSEIAVIFPPVGVTGGYSFQYGHLNSDLSVDWSSFGGDVDVWLSPPPSVTKAYLGTTIEVYNDGKNFTRLYYFFLP